MEKKKRTLINPYSKPWVLGTSVFLLSLSIILLILIQNYQHLRLQAIVDFQDNFRTETENKNNQNIDAIHHLSYSFFYSPNMSRLRLADDLASYDKILGTRTLNMMESTNEDIHSVYLYNPQMKTVFTSLESGTMKWDDFHDSDIFKANGRHFIQRYLPDKNIPIYSFVIHDDPYKMDEKGSMVVNIDAERFLKKIFTKQDFNEWIYVPDFDKMLLSNTESTLPQNVIETCENDEHYYYHKGSKEIFFISYLPKINAYLIQSTPLDVAFKELSYLRYFNFIIASTFVLSGMMIIYILYQEVFRPIHTAIKTSPNQSNSKGIAIEEWIKEQTGREQLYKQTLEVHYLRRMLLNSDNIDPSCIPQFSVITEENPMTMLMFKNKHAKELEQFNDKLLDAVEKNDYTVLFFEKFQTIHDSFITKFKESFPQVNLYISSEFSDIRAMSLHYKHLCELQKLNVFFPKLIHYETDLLAKRNDLKSELIKEDEIIRQLEAGNLEKAQEVYYSWQKDLEIFRLDTILFLYNKLYLKCIILYNEYYDDEETLDIHSYDSFDTYLNRTEKIETINQLFFSIFRSVVTKVEQLERSRFHLISSKVKEDIHRHYNDPNLSMKILAHKQNLSADYINRIFKEVEKVSISEYINLYRVEKAKELLIESNAPIKDIAKSVGMSNSSYFYTLFKKYTGISPGKWRNENQS